MGLWTYHKAIDYGRHSLVGVELLHFDAGEDVNYANSACDEADLRVRQ